MTVPHDGIVITPFRETPVAEYEAAKAKAFATHLRSVADVVSRAGFVAKCPLAPEREWVSLQVWVNDYTGDRQGQWQTDVSVSQVAA